MIIHKILWKTSFSKHSPTETGHNKRNGKMVSMTSWNNWRTAPVFLDLKMIARLFFLLTKCVAKPINRYCINIMNFHWYMKFYLVLNQIIGKDSRIWIWTASNGKSKTCHNPALCSWVPILFAKRPNNGNSLSFFTSLLFVDILPSISDFFVWVSFRFITRWCVNFFLPNPNE